MLKKLSTVFVFVLSYTLLTPMYIGAQVGERPNIIIIFTDDQGYGDLGCYGSETIRTPRIDKLAQDGIRFTNFYAQVVCGPSRSALLTSRYPIRSRGWSMPADEITIAELLQKVGYTTGCIGKWDVSNRAAIRERMPNAQGFDTYWGTLGANDNAHVVFHENNQEVGSTKDMASLTRIYTDKAIDFLKANKDGPFLLYLAHTMVHSVIDASLEFKGKSKGGLYADTVEELDYHTGRLLDTIDMLDLRDNTIVIFTTDNGPWNNMQVNLRKKHNGAVAWGSSGPLREGKGSTYEGGIRVPCIIRWPGHVSPGRISNAIFSTLDFLPTFATLTGYEMPTDRIIDGVDQTELLLGKSEKGTRNDFYYFCRNELQGVRKGKWKLILPHLKEFYGYVKDRGSKGIELYDLESDVGEKRNLAQQYPEIVRQMLAHAQAFRWPEQLHENPIRLNPSKNPLPAPAESPKKHTAHQGEKPIAQRPPMYIGVRAAADTSELFAQGQSRVYAGKYLDAISMPLGGIGGGNVQINGKAKLQSWQIFNNYNPLILPHTFFAVRLASPGAQPIVRALQSEPVGPFAAMNSLSFRGEYPFGWFELGDKDLPVEISLEAFSPLIPMDTKNSAIPCAVFNITARNTSAEPVEVVFLASQQNGGGYRTGPAKRTWGPAELPGIDGRKFGSYGGNCNKIMRRADVTVLHMTTDSSRSSSGYGDMALAVRGVDVTGIASWEDIAQLAEDFTDDGSLAGPRQAGPTQAGQTVDGALVWSANIAPGQNRTATFLLAWHFPKGTTGTLSAKTTRQNKWFCAGRMYANWWSSSLDVVTYIDKNLNELTRQTRAYHDALYETNLPRWMLDRISSQVACLKSQTCFWDKDGYFGGWEGCCSTTGCCMGNCTHVWQYAQAHARLFPSIGRRLREESLFYQNQAGGIPMRHTTQKVAFDGQCGEILGAYREHLCSTDKSWLDKVWPRVRKAMEYVIVTWDKDEDGVPMGQQHNTLDAALSGSTSWLGTLYLAALGASEKMALLEGQDDLAGRYRKIRLAGAKKQDSALFDGEYYIQIPNELKGENYLTGCHIDQLLGQWWAFQLDLGWLYPQGHVRTALRSLFKYNFRTDFKNVKTFTTGAPWKGFPRKFVRDDDHGLMMTTWPKGGRPEPGKQLRFADEVMSGFEYSAAAAMITSGLLEEGFTVVKAAEDRYDGQWRSGLTDRAWGYSGNPFGDDECGKFYARAMSIWSVLLACQGFIYDGPAGLMGFIPVWQPDDHVSFFTAAEGWGVFAQRRDGNMQTEKIEMRYGKVRVASLIFQVSNEIKSITVTVLHNQQRVPATHTIKNGQVRITLKQPVVVIDGESLLVELGQ